MSTVGVKITIGSGMVAGNTVLGNVRRVRTALYGKLTQLNIEISIIRAAFKRYVTAGELNLTGYVCIGKDNIGYFVA